MSYILEAFRKKKEPIKKKNVSENTAWIYTRVSSKGQENNASIDVQDNFVEKYCKGKSLITVKKYGYSAESAAHEESKRPKFKEMMNDLRKAKIKPKAIVVYTVSRFSRNSEAIDSVNKMHKMGVVLMVALQDITSETEEGRLKIHELILEAKADNLNRIKAIHPCIINAMQKGLFFGNVPRGYSQRGPRAKVRADTQIIEVNEDGKILKKAWKMKLKGERDYQIIEFLKDNGIQMSKQRISAMFRNPFYCGINVNKALNEPVKGNWEPLVSENEFNRVQDILKGIGRQGVKKKDKVDIAHLRRIIRCPKCENLLVSYFVKKGDKNILYYKCNTCTGSNFNANTTQKSTNEGLHELMHKLISQFKFDNEDIELIKQQIEKILKSRNSSSAEDIPKLRKELNEVKLAIKNLNVRYGLQEISLDIYKDTLEYLREKERRIETNLNDLDDFLSNQNFSLQKILEKIGNVGCIYDSVDGESKNLILRTIFNEGISINRENGQYLTKSMNYGALITATNSMNCEEKKEGLTLKFKDKSLVVARSTLLSNQIPQDLIQLYEILHIVEDNNSTKKDKKYKESLENAYC